MSFKIRDLLITVLPSDFNLGIGGECDAGSDIPPGPPDPPPPPGPDEIPFLQADIAELRVMLQYVLVQMGGPVQAAEMRPRSLQELADLEKSLSGALQEVRELRTQFNAGESGYNKRAPGK